MEIGELAYKAQNKPSLKQNFLYRKIFPNFLIAPNNSVVNKLNSTSNL